MISNEDIKTIIDDCKQNGYSIKVRDISYIILTMFFADYKTAYKSVFPDHNVTDDDVSAYNKSTAMSYLRNYMRTNYIKNSSMSDAKHADISFDENKSEMIKLIEETQSAMDHGEIDKKDGLKIISDIRVKLNDKFSIAEEKKDSIVVVESKYNSICEYCGHEIQVPTKKELMKEYNLIERNI